MILIADSGSTKCDWTLIDQLGNHISSQTTIGINPLNMSQSKIENIIFEISEVFEKRNQIDKIHFYGAGCGTDTSNQKIKASFYSIFKNLKLLKIEEDMIAAVHATTKTPAVIAILGTGSNCCYFDGKKVIQHSPSLGYILADEASGNYFGKELLKSFYFRNMPSSLAIGFKSKFGADLGQLLYNLYELKRPNAYLASYAIFLFEHRGHPFIERILHNGIKVFLDNYIMLYAKELQNHPLHFVGSIAYSTQDIINKMISERGFSVKSFVKKPIKNLINHIVSNEYPLQKTS